MKATSHSLRWAAFALVLFLLLPVHAARPENPSVFKQAYDRKSRTLDITPYIDRYGAPADCSPAVVHALADCRAHHRVRRLVFPDGTYRFRPDSLERFMTHISNNGSYERCFAFDLSGMKNLEIDGDGSLFLFKGYVCPFYVKDARNIALHDFRIDYERTFHSEGHIVDITNEYIDLQFSEEYPYEITSDSRLRTIDDEGVEYPWYYLLEFNPQRMETEWKVSDQWLGSSLRAEELGDRTVRLYHPDLKGRVGNVMNLGMARRKVPCITVSDSRHVDLQHITIYHAGGMGVIAQRSRDLLLDSIVVEPAPGKDRVVSAAADATHFVNCSGYIRMYNCRFVNQTDDASNIHGVYYRVAELQPAEAEPRQRTHALKVELANDAQYGFDYLRRGMKVEFVDAGNLETYATAKVKTARMLDDNHVLVVLASALPDSLKTGHAIAGCSEYPDVHIRGCYFGQNRARGLLLGSRARMLIEGNTFHNGGPALLFEGDARYWFEQAGVRDVIIRDNLFDNCYYGHWGRGIISVGTGLDGDKMSVCRYNRNVTITGNTFRLIQKPILSLYCMDGLVFKDNTIELSDDYSSNPDYDMPNDVDIAHPEQLFELRHCDHVDIQDVKF